MFLSTYINTYIELQLETQTILRQLLFSEIT